MPEKKELSFLPSKILLTNSTDIPAAKITVNATVVDNNPTSEILLEMLSEKEKADIAQELSENIGKKMRIYYSQHLHEWEELLKYFA